MYTVQKQLVCNSEGKYRYFFPVVQNMIEVNVFSVRIPIVKKHTVQMEPENSRKFHA